MKLGELRERVFSRSDWSPSQSAIAKARVDGFLNDALERLVRDAPFAFFERQWSFECEPDVLPASTTDTLTPFVQSEFVGSIHTTDPWIVVRDTDTGTLSSSDLWPVGGAFANRVLAFRSGDAWYRFRIREVFEFNVIFADQNTLYQCLSLIDPLSSTLQALFAQSSAWHIYRQEYSMPPNLVRLNSMWLHKASETWPLQALGQKQAEKLSLKDIPDQVSQGRPRSFFKWGRFEMPSPTQAMRPGTPSVNWTDTGDADSDTCEPPGTFDYVYTYCFGYRDEQYSQGNAGFGDFISGGANVGITSVLPNAVVKAPLFESAASPSVEAQVLLASNTAVQALQPTFSIPNLEAVQGFFPGSSYLRHKRSGWRIRVYRRRKTTVLQDATTYANAFPEETDEYFFLAELASGATTFTDTGQAVPDYSRRLIETNGQFQYGLYPRPDAGYSVNCRYLARPQKMADDSDAPPVHPEADDALIDLALHFLGESEGLYDQAQVAYARYREEHLPALRAVYGSDTTEDTVHYRVPARARRAHRGQRRWWDTNSS